jgi:hypothetical protein
MVLFGLNVPFIPLSIKPERDITRLFISHVEIF